MSMHSVVYGIRPADKKYKKMLEIYNLCIEQEIAIPDEVDDFFGGESPELKGTTIDLRSYDGVEEYNNDMQQGFEINLDGIPKDLKIIRFVNCY